MICLCMWWCDETTLHQKLLQQQRRVSVDVCIFFWSSHLLCSRRFYFILHVFIVSCMCELDSARWDNRLMCVWWRMCDVNFGVIFVVTHHKFKVSSCVGVWNRLLAFFFMFVVDGGKLMKNWLLRELFCGIPENHTHTLTLTRWYRRWMIFDLYYKQLNRHTYKIV